MASKIIACAFFVTLLIHVTFTLPVLLEVKTVQLSKNVDENVLTERTPVLAMNKNISLDEESKLVQILSAETLKTVESLDSDRVKRIKRHITKPKALCPSDMYEYGGQCLTKEQYLDYIEDPEIPQEDEENR